MSRGRRRKGLSLIELLIAIGLMCILAVAVSYAFVGGLEIERAYTHRKDARAGTAALDQHLYRMLQGAKLSDTKSDATNYFLATATNGGATTDLGCDRLTFTTALPGVTLAAQRSEEGFETQHKAGGPVGGVAEVSWSTTAVGDAGGRSGLFERLQRPSDSDATQGGMESLVSPQVDRIGFKFWNGTEWVDTWDSINGERRLPAAVKVSYALKGSEESSDRVVLIPIPTSDIDAQHTSTNGD